MNANSTPEMTTSVESVLETGWSMPLWCTFLLAAFAMAFAASLYWSERGSAGKPMRLLLATIRGLLLLSVLWMLAGWSLQKFKTEQPELAIVIDRSASMATQDSRVNRPGEDAQLQSRIDAAAELLKQIRPAARQSLLENYQIRWFSVAESLEPTPSLFSSTAQAELNANGSQTRLGDALTRLIERQAGHGTAAIVLLSDGINTAGVGLSEVERVARAAAIPIYSVVTGRQFALPDVRLADLLMDREVYFGDRVAAQVSVVASDVQQAEVRVTLREASSGMKLDETNVTINSTQNQQTAHLSFVPDHPGELHLQIEVSSIDGETELANNVLAATVDVQDKTIRVLLVHEKPSYEFRFLKSLLERTTQAGETTRSSFELRSVLQESDPDYVDQDPSALRLVPSNPQTLSDFDVFIFGEFNPNLVSRHSQQVIYDSVTESGSGCIFIYGAGAPARNLQGWPLADLLPIQAAGADEFLPRPADQLFHWQPTPLGASALPMQLAATPKQSQAVWEKLPRFSSLSEAGKTKIGAQVLANAVGGGTVVPLLITQYAGAGRVALQRTDETYRWTSFGGSDLYHQRYWGQLLRWLSRGRLGLDVQVSELLVEPRQSKFGQSLRFEARIGQEVAEADLPEVVQVVVENGPQSGETMALETLALSRSAHSNRIYQTTTNSLKPGSYRGLLVQPATASPPSQQFSIATPPGEQANLRANVEGMRSLAMLSRGKFYRVEEAETLFEDLPLGKPTRLGTLPPIPLWNSPWVALLFIVLITLEWLLRRSVRML